MSTTALPRPVPTSPASREPFAPGAHGIPRPRNTKEGRPGRRRRQRHREQRQRETRSTSVRVRLFFPSDDAAKTTRSTRPRGTRRASFFGRSAASPPPCIGTVHHAARSERSPRGGIATTSDKVAPFFFPPFVERAVTSFGLMFSGSPIFPT